MNRGRWLGALVLIVAAGLGAVLLSRDRGPRMLPEFSLPDLQGRVWKSRDLRGRVVVLNLWATWCPPCVEEMPTLERLHRGLGPKGVVVLAVSQDERPEAVPNWIAERGFTFPVLLDPYAEVGHALGVSGYPETFVVDRQGRIVHHHIGYRDWAAPEVVAALEELLDTGRWALAASATGRVTSR